MTHLASFRVLISLLVLLIGLLMPPALAAQATGTPTPERLATPVPITGDVAGLVDIGGGRKVFLECRGAGGPDRAHA